MKIISKLSNKLLSTSAFFMLKCCVVVCVICYGCDDNTDNSFVYQFDDDSEIIFIDPRVTAIDGDFIQYLMAEEQVTVRFRVRAAAVIKSIEYLITREDESEGPYTQYPLSSPETYEMIVNITFDAEYGMSGVKVKVVDRMDVTHEATVEFGRILRPLDFVFIDDLDYVEAVNIGDNFIVTGEVRSMEGITELSYVVHVGGVGQPPVTIPVTDANNTPFEIPIDVDLGLQRIEFFAKDLTNRELRIDFTFRRVKDIMISIPKWAAIYSETAQVAGQFTSHGETISSATYYVVKEDGTTDNGTPISVNSDGSFTASIFVPTGSDAEFVRIVVINSQGDDATYEGPVRSRLKVVNNAEIATEGSTQKIFGCFLQDHEVTGTQLCADALAYTDYWDFCIFWSGPNAPCIASPSIFAKGGLSNLRRVVQNNFSASCRGGNGQAPNSMIPRLAYTMISPSRPELANVFNTVQTEQDLWDLLDTPVPGQGTTTYRQLFDPVTSSNVYFIIDNTGGASNPNVNTYHWIAWGPYNGSSLQGTRGNPAQNGGLGIMRVVSYENNNGFRARLDVKFPTYPNYREKYNNSWIDMRFARSDIDLFPADFDPDAAWGPIIND